MHQVGLTSADEGINEGSSGNLSRMAQAHGNIPKFFWQCHYMWQKLGPLLQPLPVPKFNVENILFDKDIGSQTENFSKESDVYGFFDLVQLPLSSLKPPHTNHSILAKWPDLKIMCILHNDSVQPHRAHIIYDFWVKHGIRRLRHPPRSLDLAPCDFWLALPRAKERAAGCEIWHKWGGGFYGLPIKKQNRERIL